MSKQDYELIASVICQFYAGEMEARHALAVRFADALARTNPRFNNSRFIAACMKVA